MPLPQPLGYFLQSPPVDFAAISTKGITDLELAYLLSNQAPVDNPIIDSEKDQIIFDLR